MGESTWNVQTGSSLHSKGPRAPRGRGGQLIVLEARGREEISAPYEYVIDLALADGASEVDHEALLGAKATLRIMTDAEPAVRLVHGLVVEVEELSVEKGSRLRVKLAPPYARARLYRKCVIHVDQTIKDVLVETLERGSTGMELTASSGDRAEPADGDWGSYSGFKATYALRVTDVARLEDVEARPYSVQYEESDVDFVSRILEEEGIAYHFEHTAEECVLVLADADAGRRDVAGSVALSQDKLHQESRNVRAGGRLRPKAVAPARLRPPQARPRAGRRLTLRRERADDDREPRALRLLERARRAPRAVTGGAARQRASLRLARHQRTRPLRGQPLRPRAPEVRRHVPRAPARGAAEAAHELRRRRWRADVHRPRRGALLLRGPGVAGLQVSPCAAHCPPAHRRQPDRRRHRRGRTGPGDQRRRRGGLRLGARALPLGPGQREARAGADVLLGPRESDVRGRPRPRGDVPPARGRRGHRRPPRRRPPTGRSSRAASTTGRTSPPRTRPSARRTRASRA
jgi:hypothetical protein